MSRTRVTGLWAATLLGACNFGGYTSLGKNDPSDASATPSGLAWPSGTNADDPARLNGWATYRGRANDVALVITDYSSWDSVARPESVLTRFAEFVGILVIAQPFWPSHSGGSLSDCAAGAYDAQWRDFGALLQARGRGSSIVRLAWQFNGDDVEWSAREPTSFIACFRHVVSAIRTGAPAVVIDWSMGAHGASEPPSGDPFDAYPGDAFVDVVGIDAFDMTPSSRDQAAFDAQCNGPVGLCSVARFARARGKRLGVGQWAVVTCNGFGDRGGDNPFYLQEMHDVFVQNADIIAYETYYNDPNPGEFCTSLFDPVEAPSASARYRELWGL